MADGHGQGVRGVQGPALTAHIEQAPHHEGHLLLFRAAGAHHGFFDQRGFIIAHRHAMRRTSRHGHTAGLAQLEGAGRVPGREDLFDGGLLRTVTAHHVRQLPVDDGQPPGEFLFAAGGGADDAAIHQTQHAGLLRDDAPARALGAGVDPQDHKRRIRHSSPQRKKARHSGNAGQKTDICRPEGRERTGLVHIHVFGEVGVGVDVLHVVVVVQGFHETDDLLGGLGVHGHQVLGHHGQFGGLHGHTGGFQGVAHGREVGHGGLEGPDIVIVDDVVGAGFHGHFHHLVFGVGGLFHGDDALAVEHPAHAAVGAQAAAVLGEQVAHFGHGAVLVVGGHFHHDGDTGGAVTFVEAFGQVAARVLARALADGGFDLVLGQVHGLGSGNGRTQTRVARRIATVLGSDDDFLGGLGENLAALGVLTALAVLDIGPFAVPRHKTSQNSENVKGEKRQTALRPVRSLPGIPGHPGNGSTLPAFPGAHTGAAARTTANGTPLEGAGLPSGVGGSVRARILRGRTRLGPEPHAHEEGLLALGPGALGLERFDGLEGAAHGLEHLLDVRPHENLDDEAAAGLEVQARHFQGLAGQLERTGLVRELGPGGTGRHVAHDHVEGPHLAQAGFKGIGAVEHVLLHEGDLRREGGLRGLDVAAQHEPARAHLFGGAQRPRARSRAQIQNAHPLAEELELRVQFLELVHGTGRIILALGLEKIMIPIFLHNDTSGLL